MTRLEEADVLKSVIDLLEPVAPFESRSRIIAAVMVFFGCEEQVAKNIIRASRVMAEMANAVKP